MRRDFSQPLHNLDGSEAKDASEKVITFASTTLTALLNQAQGEQMTAELKTRRYQLAMKINKNPSKVDLTIEELALAKDCVGKFHGPLVVGQTYEMLEQEPKLVEAPAQQ